MSMKVYPFQLRVDTESLNIGLVSFIYSVYWASLSHKEFFNWNFFPLLNKNCCLVSSSKEREFMESLNVEDFPGTVSSYKSILSLLILAG